MTTTSVMPLPPDADAHFELNKIVMQIENLALARQLLKPAIKNGTTFETEAANRCNELDKRKNSRESNRTLVTNSKK